MEYKKHGGARPGSGRPKGRKTARTVALAEALKAQGETPLEVMLSLMRAYWKEGRYPEAVAIAEKAAPYMHPKLAAVNLSVKPISQMTEEELDAALASASAMDTMTETDTDGVVGLVH